MQQFYSFGGPFARGDPPPEGMGERRARGTRGGSALGVGFLGEADDGALGLGHGLDAPTGREGDLLPLPEEMGEHRVQGTRAEGRRRAAGADHAGRCKTRWQGTQAEPRGVGARRVQDTLGSLLEEIGRVGAG